MVRAGLLKQSRLVSVGQVTGSGDSDIEDLFSEAEYLGLYNEAFGKSIDAAVLQGSGSIVKRIERVAGGKFDHLRPALVCMRKRDSLRSVLSSDTLARFQALINLLNATFPSS
jgi:hypothetical protein